MNIDPRLVFLIIAIMYRMNQTKKEKILIIESDTKFGEQVVEALKNDGYPVSLVKNGAEGLRSLMDTMPHLVLVDVSLEGMDGYEVLEKKQAEPLLAKIPVFLMSSQGVPINMQRVPPGSVVEFLMALHSNPSDIVEKVDKHFGNDVMDIKELDAKNEAKKKLLWVEDDKLIGTILAKKLIASGFDLSHAKNGEEALSSLKQKIPDVVVLDLLLPGMSGFDILQQIRMDEKLKNVPVIILSNLSKPSDIDKAKMLGAQKFLVKAATSLDQIVSEIKGAKK